MSYGFWVWVMKTESCLNQTGPEFVSIEAHWSYCSFPQFIFSFSLPLSFSSFLVLFMGTICTALNTIQSSLFLIPYNPKSRPSFTYQTLKPPTHAFFYKIGIKKLIKPSKIWILTLSSTILNHRPTISSNSTDSRNLSYMRKCSSHGSHYRY